MKIPVPSNIVERSARELLRERGVELEDIASIVYELQAEFNPNISMLDCIKSVNAVLWKREVQHAVLVGIELDKLAEKGVLSEPLLSLIRSDEGLFGVDETIALGSVFGFGSIAVTTFGFLDKAKPGIIKKLDKNEDECHTFLDDLVCSIAASAAARIAHHYRDKEEQLSEAEILKRENEELIG